MAPVVTPWACRTPGHKNAKTAAATTARLERFARDVAEHERRAVRPASTIRVEVWRAEFDGEPLTGRARQLRAVVLALDDPDV